MYVYEKDEGTLLKNQHHKIFTKQRRSSRRRCRGGRSYIWHQPPYNIYGSSMSYQRKKRQRKVDLYIHQVETAKCVSFIEEKKF